VTLIYLVQHGEKERVASDPGLTALGRGQAEVTAGWLRARGLHGLRSSPLRRAQETAAPIAAATNLPAQLDTRLRERLNWDGSQTIDAFLRTGRARLRIGISSLATVSFRIQQANECWLLLVV
jgi:phosphohistidine phosphatase SixA